MRVFVLLFGLIQCALSTMAPMEEMGKLVTIDLTQGEGGPFQANATVGDTLSIIFKDSSKTLYQFYTEKAYEKCKFDSSNALKVAKVSEYNVTITANMSVYYIVDNLPKSLGGWGNDKEDSDKAPEIPENITIPEMGQFSLYYAQKGGSSCSEHKRKVEVIVDYAPKETTPPTLSPIVVTNPPTASPAPAVEQQDGDDDENSEQGQVVGLSIGGSAAFLILVSAAVVMRRNSVMKKRIRASHAAYINGKDGGDDGDMKEVIPIPPAVDNNSSSIRSSLARAISLKTESARPTSGFLYWFNKGSKSISADEFATKHNTFSLRSEDIKLFDGQSVGSEHSSVESRKKRRKKVPVSVNLNKRSDHKSRVVSKATDFSSSSKHKKHSHGEHSKNKSKKHHDRRPNKSHGERKHHGGDRKDKRITWAV